LRVAQAAPAETRGVRSRGFMASLSVNVLVTDPSQGFDLTGTHRFRAADSSTGRLLLTNQ
jgi:hypothetical protein